MKSIFVLKPKNRNLLPSPKGKFLGFVHRNDIQQFVIDLEIRLNIMGIKHKKRIENSSIKDINNPVTTTHFEFESDYTLQNIIYLNKEIPENINRFSKPKYGISLVRVYKHDTNTKSLEHCRYEVKIQSNKGSEELNIFKNYLLNNIFTEIEYEEYFF